MADNQVEMELGIDSKQVDKELRQVSRSIETFGKDVSSAFKMGSQSLETFKGTIAGLVVFKGLEAGLSLVTGAFNAFVGSVDRVITEASNADIALNNLNQALIRSGQYTPQASKELQDFSSQLQATSTFGDDAAQSSLGLLSSLTRLDIEGLKGATQAAANLATVLNIDLDSATRLVAKAANGNITAFQRYGIEIQKGVTDSQTFANTLKVLNERFGGAAQGQLRTYSGAVASLKNNFGDFLETIGFIITRSPAVVGLINAISKTIISLNNALGEKSFQSFVQDAIIGSISAFEQSVRVIDFWFRSITAVFNGVFVLIQAVPTAFSVVFESIFKFLASVTQSIPVIGTVFQSVLDGAKELSSFLKGSLSEDVEDFKNSFSADTKLESFANGIKKIREETVAFAAEAALRPAQQVNARLSEEEGVDQSILEQRRQLYIDLAAIDEQARLQNEELRIQRQLIEDQNNIAELEKLQLLETEKILIQARAEEEKAKLIQDSQVREATLNKIAAQTSINLKKKQLQDEIAIEQARRNLLNQNLTATSQFLQAGILLAKQNSKEQQALAIANALVSTYQAVANGLATKPFIPAGLAAAALAAAQGFAAVRGITSQRFESGGIVGGSSFTGDKIGVRVNSGEMILNREQQTQLFKDLNESKGNGVRMEDLAESIKSQPVVVQIDGREVFRAIRDQLNQGMRLA